MSAFLVEKTTIDRILTLLGFECRKAESFRREIEKELLIDVSDDKWRDRLGQKMLDLNQLALGFRYGDKKLNLNYVYFPAPNLLSHIQTYKSLKCWLYQCSKGEIPESSKLYKVFRDKITGHIAMAILERSPEYTQADWA